MKAGQSGLVQGVLPGCLSVCLRVRVMMNCWKRCIICRAGQEGVASWARDWESYLLPECDSLC